METEIKFPKTLHEAIKYFADPDVAHRFFVMLRWPDGVTCPYCGGKEANKHKDKKRNAGRGPVGKEIVMGILERGGEVRVKHIPDTEKDTLQSEIKANVEKDSEVFTDAARSYRGLSPEFKHDWVDH